MVPLPLQVSELMLNLCVKTGQLLNVQGNEAEKQGKGQLPTPASVLKQSLKCRSGQLLIQAQARANCHAIKSASTELVYVSYSG